MINSTSIGVGIFISPLHTGFNSFIVASVYDDVSNRPGRRCFNAALDNMVPSSRIHHKSRLTQPRNVLAHRKRCFYAPTRPDIAPYVNTIRRILEELPDKLCLFGRSRLWVTVVCGKCMSHKTHQLSAGINALKHNWLVRVWITDFDCGHSWRDDIFDPLFMLAFQGVQAFLGIGGDLLVDDLMVRRA